MGLTKFKEVFMIEKHFEGNEGTFQRRGAKLKAQRREGVQYVHDELQLLRMETILFKGT